MKNDTTSSDKRASEIIIELQNKNAKLEVLRLFVNQYKIGM